MASLFGNLDDEKLRIRERAVAGWGVVESIPGTRNGVDVSKSAGEPDITKKFNQEEPRGAHGRWVHMPGDEPLRIHQPGDRVIITGGVYRGHRGEVVRSGRESGRHDIKLDSGRGRQAHQVPSNQLQTEPPKDAPDIPDPQIHPAGSRVRFTGGIYRGHHGTVTHSYHETGRHNVLLDGGRGRMANMASANDLMDSEISVPPKAVRAWRQRQKDVPGTPGMNR